MHATEAKANVARSRELAIKKVEPYLKDVLARVERESKSGKNWSVSIISISSLDQAMLDVLLIKLRDLGYELEYSNLGRSHSISLRW